MTTTPTDLDPTRRFSNRVVHYVRSRPGYPDGVRDTFADKLGLGPGSVVADVGSGTGILTMILLDMGCTVHAVEPNAAMRAAAEDLLAGNEKFVSVDGTAEATTLPDGSVDCVTAAQAFHWFDLERARAEFRRILRPGGQVALVWNERRTAGKPFAEDYEALLLEFSLDLEKVRHEYVTEEGSEALPRFFRDGYTTLTMPNEQRFDFEGVRSRLLSSSYMPAEEDPRSEPMLARLREIFDRHQQDGRIVMEYETQIFYGSLEGE